jgi:hypothetical protein
MVNSIFVAIRAFIFQLVCLAIAVQTGLNGFVAVQYLEYCGTLYFLVSTISNSTCLSPHPYGGKSRSKNASASLSHDGPAMSTVHFPLGQGQAYIHWLGRAGVKCPYRTVYAEPGENIIGGLRRTKPK